MGLDPELIARQSEAAVAGALADAAQAVGDGALSRVWLTGPGDSCRTCAMAPECPERTACLHLVASSGASRRVEGAFRRFPLGAREVGRVARTLEPWSADVGAVAGLAEPAWIDRHRIVSFAAIPIVHAGRGLGVLALFSRRALGPGDLTALAALATLAGGALATRPAPGPAPPGPAGPRARPWLRPWREQEREILERVLAHTGGVVSGPRGAAAILGLKPTTLDSRLKKLGVRKPDRR